MSKIAFVFSGQGAQYPGMGRSLSEISPAVKALYTAAESIRPGISALSFDGTADELKQTINTQPTLYLVDLGAALALKEAGITPDVVGGFSLGELPALAFAGAYTAEEGFSLVLKRAQFMSQASDEMPDTPAMAAVMRMSPEDIEAVCAKLENVYPANYNAPEQTVISGTVSGVAAFKNYCAENGIAARLVDLPVSGAFHTPFMAGASDKFGAVLADFAFKSVEIPAYANLTGGLYPDDPAKYGMCGVFHVKKSIGCNGHHVKCRRAALNRSTAMGVSWEASPEGITSLNSSLQAYGVNIVSITTPRHPSTEQTASYTLSCRRAWPRKERSVSFPPGRG